MSSAVSLSMGCGWQCLRAVQCYLSSMDARAEACESYNGLEDHQHEVSMSCDISCVGVVIGKRYKIFYR